jgi:hypothetical protein
MLAVMGQILIGLRAFWARRSDEDMRLHVKSLQRRPGTSAVQPLRGASERVCGQRCVSYESGRIPCDPRLAKNSLRSVKTGPITGSLT